MLKRILTKAEFDKLSKDMQTLYEKDEEGDVYSLVEKLVDGEEPPGALKRALQREKEKAVKAVLAQQAAEEKLTELQTQLDAIPAKDRRSSEDIQTFEKVWQAKLDKAKLAADEKIAKKDAFLRQQLSDNVALKIATEISTAPELILPHIQKRISVDLTGDTPRTLVLDADGTESTLTLAELTKEFRANKSFATIIIGSKASGAGSGGGRNGGSAPSGKKLSELSETERIDLYKSDPEEFKRLSAESKKQ